MSSSQRDQRTGLGAERPRVDRRGIATMPSNVDEHRSVFDRFASRAAGFVSRAWFFLLCVLLVVLWGPSLFLLDSLDTWQLVINTITAILTFLLVALLQNTQKRTDDAMQQKLNAIAEGLSDVLNTMAEERPRLRDDRHELREAVALENRESSA